jgi:hypothetical protein
LHAETNLPLANDRQSKKRPKYKYNKESIQYIQYNRQLYWNSTHNMERAGVLSSGVGRRFKGRSSEQRRFVTGENIIIIIIIIFHKSLYRYSICQKERRMGPVTN